MNGYEFTLAGAQLVALGSGAVFWPAQELLCLSDLHLGTSEQQPELVDPYISSYETRQTLGRLEADIRACRATTIICLGKSFDPSSSAQALQESEKLWISALQAGRRWVWIKGDHDPGPVELGGVHLTELPRPPVSFRHIARPGQSGEISGHYHPKIPVQTTTRTITRPAFLIDSDRVILPAYGKYSDDIHYHDETLKELMRKEALAVLTGPDPQPMPMPRSP